MDINRENIDEYLLLLLDGELTEAAEKEVMAIVESSPEHKALLEAYMLTKLEEEFFVFEEKAMLLKREAVTMPLKGKRIYVAVAAAIAVILCTGVLWKMLLTDEHPASSLITHHTYKKVITADTVRSQPLLVKQNDQKMTRRQITAHTPYKQSPSASVNTTVLVPVRAPRVEELNSLPVAGLKPMDDMQYKKATTPEIDVPAFSYTAPENTAVINGDDTDTGKPALLNALIAQFETTKNNVAEKAKSIRITAVSIQLGNKEITIGK